jgi:hypothetical protein
MRRPGFPALFLAGSLVWAAFPLAAGSPPSSLPADGFREGWSRSGHPRVFSGEALYDHIDGGAETFLEMGFRNCTVQKYSGLGGADLILEIYAMRDPEAALGIYLMNCGRETPDPALPDRNTAGRDQIRAVKGAAYVVATAGSGQEESRGALAAAVGASLALAAPASTPACLAWLPEAESIAGSLRIVRGALGLQAVLPFAESDLLRLADGGATAVAADFSAPGGTTIRLVAEYESPSAALAGAAALAAALGAQPPGSAGSPFEARSSDGRLCRVAVSGTRLLLEAKPPTPGS